MQSQTVFYFIELSRYFTVRRVHRVVMHQDYIMPVVMQNTFSVIPRMYVYKECIA